MEKTDFWEKMENHNRYSDEESQFEKEELVKFYLNELSEHGLDELDDPNSVGTEFFKTLGITKEDAINILNQKEENKTTKRH